MVVSSIIKTVTCFLHFRGSGNTEGCSLHLEGCARFRVGLGVDARHSVSTVRNIVSCL